MVNQLLITEYRRDFSKRSVGGVARIVSLRHGPTFRVSRQSASLVPSHEIFTSNCRVPDLGTISLQHCLYAARGSPNGYFAIAQQMSVPDDRALMMVFAAYWTEQAEKAEQQSQQQQQVQPKKEPEEPS